MKKILVLCSGNSARSQMAEGYLNFYAAEKGLFFSAGLENRGINPLTLEVMAEDNIDISEHASKSYHLFKKVAFDYILVVCDQAYQKFPASLNGKQVIHFSIPDPDEAIGTTEERLIRFRQIREVVKKHILRFIGKELTEEPVAVL